jgi:hypothetical protein
MELNRTLIHDDQGRRVDEVSHGLGHHWRFSVPLYWQWSYYEQKSSFVPNLKARIDYHEMLYEAVTGLVALALLFLLLPALAMPLRKITALRKGGDPHGNALP